MRAVETCFDSLPRPKPTVVGGPETGSPERESEMPGKTCFFFYSLLGRSQ